jgi:hypothetical protein
MMGKLILTGVLIATASVVQAQESTGTNIRGQESASPVHMIGGTVERELTPMEEQARAEALRAGRVMASCFAGRRPATVTEILNSASGENFAAAMKKSHAVMGPCLVRAGSSDAGMMQMNFSRFDMMGLLAEAAMVRSPAPAFEALPIAAVPRFPQWIAGSMGQAVMLQVATCLAYTQPRSAQAVVWAKPGTPQESAAFGQLVAHLPSCLDKNVTLKATKPALRLALATALYQRKINPAPVVPPSGAKGGN